MTNPRELKEYPQLQEKTYPFRLFFNTTLDTKVNQNILFLHWHEHFEIIVMEQGSAVFHIDSQPYEAQQGDVLIVPSGGLHVGYSLQGGDIRYVSIVIHSTLFNDWVPDPLHEKFVAPYLDNRLQFPVKPDEQNQTSSVYYSLLSGIIAEYQEKGPAYQLIIKNQLHLLFTLLSRAFLPHQQIGKPKERLSINRERFKPLLEHLEVHFTDKISIEEAAKSVNLNPYHFCKTFKKLTGRTFVDYVNVCRMDEAERLLLETHLSVTEIAGTVGCDNPNYFTKLYKQYKGLTPSQARK
ncbi:helix-turn-helix transcriptional regulator [Paenibacillus wynnii]|uniref:AraC family transcriptional regulator n=1 Tax=Paenibacillus wynnii TaxID=268407 RepID=A0A098M555_9BACL|nr:helix-turn-helix domain-containing protein [Paenibacillus wynnii]KGE17168.1 AraC family transcriptional regulator [Paenibacillus wynnii]